MLMPIYVFNFSRIISVSCKIVCDGRHPPRHRKEQIDRSFSPYFSKFTLVIKVSAPYKNCGSQAVNSATDSIYRQNGG
jgi:hypothetical protein